MEKKNFKIKDKNTIFTGFCLTIAFILTIVLSFGVSFYFRPINDSTFWGNLLVALALCIYTLYFGISESLNYYRKKDGGRYQNAINNFKNIREIVSKKDNELPKQLYSWQVFLTKKDALRWLMLYNYNLEDYNIVEYNKDDIEDWSVVDLFI